MAIYTAILKPCEGGYTVEVPVVPGCVTGGTTIEEDIRMAKDALGGCLCVYEDEGVSLPEPRILGQFDLDDGAFAARVDIDTVE